MTKLFPGVLTWLPERYVANVGGRFDRRTNNNDTVMHFHEKQAHQKSIFEWTKISALLECSDI